MDIRFRNEAVGDLAAIHASIATDRPIVAEKVVDKILQNIETITLFPYLGRTGDTCNTLEWITPGLPYIIVYQVDVRANQLVVLAIFHDS